MISLKLIKPYFLVLIPLIALLIFYSYKRMNFSTKRKKNIILVLRTIIFLFLILALCGTNVYWKVDTTTTIFLVDASDSVLENRKDFEGFIKEAIRNKGAKDRIGVISFGENSQIESFISKDSSFDKIESKVNGNYTNLENVLASALSLMPNNSRKRIVLLTDGEENKGATSKIVPSLLDQGIDFKVYKVEKNIGEEVAVDSINLPKKLILGEEFGVTVNISSTVATSAKLTLFNGKQPVGQQKVELQKGVNKFVFKDKALSGGFKGYRVIIEPEKDKEIRNNEASTFTNIMAKPKILVIEDTKGEAEELVKILKASEQDYTLVNAISAPRTLQEMSAYKSIITCNVSAENLNEGFLNSLESYVKDFGGGFLATGGDNSFALGGYTKTPLEKVLPVYMDMRGKKEIPKMSLMLIIDKSGSMTEGIAGISKVDMAKEAAIRSLGSLRTGKDEIGVLTFDGAYSWVVNRQLIKDQKAIESDIATIRAGGGTSILPALAEGYKSLKESDAKIKHIILLTDGQAEREGYDPIIEDCKKNNITVSTVAVGQDSDRGLLENIAKNSGGRFYVTDEYTNIPRIFAKETFMAARMYLNNREFTPVIATNHSILQNVAEGGLPTLLGYIGASPKETSRVILNSDEEDPILTVWQYGLGKTLAWNSDISGKWSANYISWGKSIRLWQNMINYTLENYNSENLSIEVEEEGGKANITIVDNKNAEEMKTKATIITPSNENVEIELYPIAPGKYSASLDLKESGVYMINGKQFKNGEVTSAVNTGYAMQYSPEYKIGSGKNVIENLIKETEGKIIIQAKEVFQGEIKDKKGQLDLTPYLLAISLLLFLLDVAIRRLNLNMYRIKAKLFTIFSKLNFKRGKVLSQRPNLKISKNVMRDHSNKIIDPYEKVLDNNINNTLKKETKEEKVIVNEKDAKDSLDTSALLKNKKFKDKK